MTTTQLPIILKAGERLRLSLGNVVIMEVLAHPQENTAQLQAAEFWGGLDVCPRCKNTGIFRWKENHGAEIGSEPMVEACECVVGVLLTDLEEASHILKNAVPLETHKHLHNLHERFSQLMLGLQR